MHTYSIHTQSKPHFIYKTCIVVISLSPTSTLSHHERVEKALCLIFTLSSN